MLGLGIGVGIESSRSAGGGSPPVDPYAAYWNGDHTILDLTDAGLSGTLQLVAHKATVEEIKIGGNTFDTITLTHCPALTLISGWPNTFYPDMGPLRHLTINHCDALTAVDFHEQSNDQAIVSANLNHNASLANVRFDGGGLARGGALTSLTVDGCTALQFIQCQTNQLTTLDLSDSADLQNVTASGNNLSSIVLPNTSSSPVSMLNVGDNPLTALDIGQLHVASVLASNHAISTFAPAAGAQCPAVSIQNGTVPIAIDLSQLPACTSIDVRGQEVTALSYPADLSGLTLLKLQNTVSHPIALPNLSGCPALALLTWTRTGLTTINISPCPSLQLVQLNFQALNQANVDGVLTTLDANGVSSGACQIRFGTSSTPGAGGLTAKTNLQGKGWTVTNN